MLLSTSLALCSDKCYTKSQNDPAYQCTSVYTSLNMGMYKTMVHWYNGTFKVYMAGDEPTVSFECGLDGVEDFGALLLGCAVNGVAYDALFVDYDGEWKS